MRQGTEITKDTIINVIRGGIKVSHHVLKFSSPIRGLDAILSKITKANYDDMGRREAVQCGGTGFD